MDIEYDVSICCSGEDSRYSFVSHLEAALRRRGIKTYVDDDPEKGSVAIDLRLVRTIEKSKVFLIILSKNFLYSPYRLSQLTKLLEERRKNEQIVVPIFYSVDPSDIRNQTGRYAKALKRHEERYSEDEVQRWRLALGQTVSLAGWSSSRIRNEAILVDEIVRYIENNLWRTSRTKARIEWAVVITNFILEIPSAVFDQLSSAHKPLYALLVMLISLLSFLVCIADFIHRARAERVGWRWRWPIPWFHYSSPSSNRFGSFSDTVGFTCALCQCIVTIINYSSVMPQMLPSRYRFGQCCLLSVYFALSLWATPKEEQLIDNFLDDQISFSCHMHSTELYLVDCKKEMNNV